MKRRAGVFVVLFALSWSHLLESVAAAEGPVRSWLKERRAEQQGANENTEATRPISKSGDYFYTIQHDGLTRRYRIHVPRGYDAKRPTPMLVALHGGGGSMDYQAEDAKYGLITKSDQEGFIVVFPNGYSRRKSGILATWNAGTCCGAARDENVDDVGFIRRVVANVAKQLNVDRSRIYSTGMSNGGLMSYRLACEMSDVFKAVAPVAGTDNTRVCTPLQPVSILHIHARNDSHVLFEGGAGPDSFKSAVTEFASVPDTIAKWVELNRCPSKPQRVLEIDGAYCDLYSPCENGSAVQLCVTESGGHSWPGGQKPRGEAPSRAISANDVMWDFFKQSEPSH